MTAGSELQSLPSEAHRLVEVYRIVGGGAVTEVSREGMELGYPIWASAGSGVPVNYIRHPRNPYRFFIYPPPLEGLQLFVEYAEAPDDVGVEDQIPFLPDTYLPAVVDGVMFLVSSVDDEHVNSGRSKLFLDAFTQMLGVGLQSREVTDSEDAAIGRRVREASERRQGNAG